jgi:adenosylcobinamide kinase/adenosylcobinamide-phosphate guanylyltransferase
MSKIVLFTGGARSGKSSRAEQYAAYHQRPVVYLATAEARDDEMQARIAQHQAQRPGTWRTYEEPLAVSAVLATLPQGTLVLLDCLSLLVSNLLLAHELNPQFVVSNEVASMLNSVQQRNLTLIVVSNEVGMGIVPEYPLGRIYRDLLGRANQQVAAAAAEVYVVVCGIVIDVRAQEAIWARQIP